MSVVHLVKCERCGATTPAGDKAQVAGLHYWIGESNPEDGKAHGIWVRMSYSDLCIDCQKGLEDLLKQFGDLHPLPKSPLEAK